MNKAPRPVPVSGGNEKLAATWLRRSLAPSLLLFIVPLLLTACKPSSADSPDSSDIKRIKAEDIKPGPFLHGTLTPPQVERIRKLKAALGEVDGSSLEKWVDDFRRDEDPDREIAVFESIAQAYSAFCSTSPRTLAQRQDALGLLMERSGTTDEGALKYHALTALTSEEAKEVLSHYTHAAMPIQVRKR